MNLPFNNYRFEKRLNIHDIFAYYYHKFYGKTNFYHWNSFNDLNLHKVDFFHFFNGVSFGKKAWVSHFETSLPKWGEISDKMIEKGLRLIAGNSCKKIIAISDCAMSIQKKLLHDKFYKYASEIESKMIVLHPPQKELISSIGNKQFSEKVIFTIVGAEFFRKGGNELLSAFNKLREEGYDNWTLNIISSMKYGDRFIESSHNDYIFAYKLINKLTKNIKHYNYLPNNRVLDILKDSNVGLLPTLWDSYGYSVLECQAAACPVISTDILALPEINNNEIGWVILRWSNLAARFSP